MIHEGIILRDEGLTRAVDHAERVDPGWKDKVWNLFERWIAKKPIGFKFLLEDFRTDVEKFSKLDSPPSKRAYGFIPAKAARLNLIQQVGTQKVKKQRCSYGKCCVLGKIIGNVELLRK